MSIFGRNKKVTVFALTSKKVQNKFLTISDDKLNVLEYAMKVLKLEHQDHYDSWCQLKKINGEDPGAWLEYFANCISDEEKGELQIVKVKYKIKDIAAMLRMLGNCYPLGCSFDTILEQEYFNNLINEKNAIQEAKNQAEKSNILKENNSDGNK